MADEDVGPCWWNSQLVELGLSRNRRTFFGIVAQGKPKGHQAPGDTPDSGLGHFDTLVHLGGYSSWLVLRDVLITSGGGKPQATIPRVRQMDAVPSEGSPLSLDLTRIFFHHDFPSFHIHRCPFSCLEIDGTGFRLVLFQLPVHQRTPMLTPQLPHISRCDFRSHPRCPCFSRLICIPSHMSHAKRGGKKQPRRQNRAPRKNKTRPGKMGKIPQGRRLTGGGDRLSPCSCTGLGPPPKRKNT